jgi:hypothetical protein
MPARTTQVGESWNLNRAILLTLLGVGAVLLVPLSNQSIVVLSFGLVAGAQFTPYSLREFRCGKFGSVRISLTVGLILGFLAWKVSSPYPGLAVVLLLLEAIILAWQEPWEQVLLPF